MPWGQFLTYVLQFVIVVVLGSTLGFIVSAMIAGVRKSMRGDR